MKKRDETLLSQIEDGVASSQPLADLLRKCVLLGGQAGSVELREWASGELKGYDGDNEVPDYRTVPAPILADAAVWGGRITGERIGVSGLPDFVQADIAEEHTFRDGVGALEALAAGSPDSAIKLSLPMAVEIAGLMDAAVDAPGQRINSLYWSVSKTAVVGILDRIRTTLTELIGEVRASVPHDGASPSQAAVDRAVNIAVHGKGARVSYTSVTASDDSVAVNSIESASESGVWTKGRIVGAGLAGVVTASGVLVGIARTLGWI